MAYDNRSIVITLKLDKGATEDTDISAQTGSVNASGASTNTTGGGSSGAGATSKGIAIAAAVQFTYQVLETAKSETLGWAEYLWNRELMLNDDYIGQRNKQIAMTQINRGMGVVSSVGQGALAGSAFGPIGAIVGAAIGLATSAAGIARSNIQAQDQQNIALRQMNAQLDFTRSRKGWSLQAASIGEDL